MPLFQGGRNRGCDHHLPSRGGEDAPPRFKLWLRHPSQASPHGRGGEEGRGGAMQGHEVERQGRPPVCLPSGPWFPVLGECAAAESQPAFWVGDADPLLHPIPTMPTTPVKAVGVPRPNLGEGAHRPLHHCSGKGSANCRCLGLPLSYRGARGSSRTVPRSRPKPGGSRAE